MWRTHWHAVHNDLPEWDFVSGIHIQGCVLSRIPTARGSRWEKRRTSVIFLLNEVYIPLYIFFALQWAEMFQMRSLTKQVLRTIVISPPGGLLVSCSYVTSCNVDVLIDVFFPKMMKFFYIISHSLEPINFFPNTFFICHNTHLQ